MIDLEDHVIDIQNGKLIQRTYVGKDGLARVLQAVDSQIELEANRPLGDNLLRSKRKEAEDRKSSILDGLLMEKERILMATEEGLARWVQFHAIKNYSRSATTRFIQRKEMMLVSQKNKWKLRVQEFTKRIIDDLQVEDDRDSPQAVLENEMIFHLQESIKRVMALQPLDMVILNKVISFLVSIKYNSVLLLYYGCQLHAMMCEFEQEFLQGKQGHSNWACITAMTSLLPAAMSYIRTAEAIADMALVLLPGAIQATKALLQLHYAARYCQFMNQSSGHSRHSVDFSAKRKSKDEGVILRGVRDAWEAHHESITSNIVDCLNLLQHSFHQPPFDHDYVLHEQSVKGHVTIGTLRKVFINDQTVLADLLQCARMIYLIPSIQTKDTIDESDELIKEQLINRALRVSALAISQYSMRLGQAPSSAPLAIRDPLFFKVHDFDAIAALDCLTVILANGEFHQDTLAIIHEATCIIQHRYYSFFYATAYIKCILAAALYYVHHGSQHRPATGELLRSSRQKDPLPSILSESADKIMAICCAHRNSLTICHKGFLTLRLLMTDAFMKRTVIEDASSKPLLRELDPWICGDKIVEKDDEDDEDGGGGGAGGAEGEDEEGTVATASTALTGMTSSVQSLGNISTLTSLEPPAYLLKFKQVIARQAFHDNQLPLTEMNFIDVVKYAFENHSQSVEVLEQTLLLIDHLAKKAHMCKYLLVESGLPLLLQRMLDSRPGDLYIAALVAVCVEDLDI